MNQAGQQPESFATLPLGKGVSIVKAEGGILALFKPEGVRSHPNEGEKADFGALIDAPFDPVRECYVLADGRREYLLHRLDAPTSGLILVAADEKLAVGVKKLFAEHKVRKTYEALVFGDAGHGRRTWRDRLRTEKSARGVRTSVGCGDVAVVEVDSLKIFRARCGLVVSRIALMPATGRTHQLRVQCAARRLPIVGDATYGDFALNRRAARDLGIRRLCLHAAKIRFEAEIDGRKVAFEAGVPAPEFFENIP